MPWCAKHADTIFEIFTQPRMNATESNACNACITQATKRQIKHIKGSMLKLENIYFAWPVVNSSDC